MNIRPLMEKDIPHLTDDNLSPDTIKPEYIPSLMVVVDDEDKPQVVFAFQYRLLIEPLLVVGQLNPKALRLAMGWIDGKLHPYQYEFFVPFRNQRFIDFCHKELPVTSHEEEPGVFFTRRR